MRMDEMRRVDYSISSYQHNASKLIHEMVENK